MEVTKNVVEGAETTSSVTSILNEDLKADVESLWQILSDAADMVLGVKDHPARLLKITNTVIGCLLFSVIFLYVKLPPTNPQSPPIDWASIHYSLWPRDILSSSMVLAKSPHTISWMLGGFVTLLLMLSFLINAVGAATIKAHYERSQHQKRD